MLNLWGKRGISPKNSHKSGRKGETVVDGSKDDAAGNNTISPGRAAKPVRFIGSFNHSLDNKGRLVIPQSFRDKLGETFCIAPSFDFQSVAI